MDNMAELYAMLFAYGVMFTVIWGACSSSDASAYGFVPTRGCRCLEVTHSFLRVVCAT